MNQKWESFKSELRKEIQEDRKNTYQDRLNQFKVFIQPYTNTEITYKSALYKKVSKKLSDLYLRDYNEETVYQVIKRNNIPYEYKNGNLVIK